MRVTFQGDQQKLSTKFVTLIGRSPRNLITFHMKFSNHLIILSAHEQIVNEVGE